MNTSYGRYSAAYNMVGFSCFNEELSLLPKNPTEAKLFSCNNMIPFHGKSFQISITDICSPEVKTIELGKEGNDS
jgi:hypothetical protein